MVKMMFTAEHFMSTVTVSIQMIDAALQHYPGSREEVQRLFRRHEVPLSLLDQPQARISAENYSGLLQDLMIAMGDEMLGYARMPHRLGTWKMMCHAVITAETLGEALRRYCHFFRLFDWGMTPRLMVEEGEAILTLTQNDLDRPLEHYAHVSTLFYYHRFASWLVNTSIPILEVDFGVPRPWYADEFGPMYRYAPVRCDQPLTCLSIAENWLYEPVRQTPQTLQDFVQNPNLVMVSRPFEQDTWQSRVRTRLAQDPARMPRFEALAGEWHLNPQTLRRRLQREGLSFNEIRSQVRRDQAIYYLTRSARSVEDIGYRVGFAEPSNFIRAFRGWTGVTPYTYRKRR